MGRAADMQLLVGSARWLADHESLVSKYFDMVRETDAKTLKKLSSFETSPEVLAIIKKPVRTNIEVKGVVLFLDEIRDPGNLGSILRSNEWFGNNIVICSKSCVDVYNPKAVQASMGAVLSANVLYVDPLVFLDEHPHMDLLVADSAAKTELQTLELSNDTLIAIGNESSGVSKEIAKRAKKSFRIPGKGSQTESLNASVASALILYHLFTKQLI